MKTKEELSALKEEVENLNKKLTELNEDELKEVVGGNDSSYYFNRMTEIELDRSLSISEKEAMLRNLKGEAANDPDLSQGIKYIVVDTIAGLLGYGR